MNFIDNGEIAYHVVDARLRRTRRGLHRGRQSSRCRANCQLIGLEWVGPQYNERRGPDEIGK